MNGPAAFVGSEKSSRRGIFPVGNGQDQNQRLSLVDLLDDATGSDPQPQ